MTADPAALRPLRVGRRQVTGLLVGGVVAGACGVLLLWWRAPSTRALADSADLAVGLGRASGMLAAYLLMVEIALMARVPVLERRVGTDVLVRVHRWLGSYLFGLVVVHVVATVVGYASGGHASVWHEARTLVLGYPYVLLAAVALLLLAGVVGLSARRVRPRLRYETWHYLHMTAYVAAGLAIAHEVVDGLQFTSDRPLAHLWVEANVVVLLVVLRYRFVEPLRVWLRHDFRVSAVTTENDGSVTVTVTGIDVDRLRVLPGQYFRWRFLTARTWWVSHPFSLSQLPTSRVLRMTAKPVGDHTRRLPDLAPGTPVLLEGPYGAVTPALRRGARLLLVAAGSGIGPMLALAQSAIGLGTYVTLVYRVHDVDQALFAAELEELARTGSVDVHIVAGPRHDTDVRRFLRRSMWSLAGAPGALDVYLCGPEGFVAEVRHLARGMGVDAGRVHTESFAW